MKGKPIPERVQQRAARSYTVDEETGCWVSNYAATINGYASLTIKDPGRKPEVFLAHRAAWTLHHGPIGKGLVIDHMCFNRKCVNPKHLRELSRRENSMRKTGDAWPLGTCKWGHPDSERIEVFWKSRAVRTECGACRREVNTANSQRDAALRRLELVYGLALTRAQQTMVDEFMPAIPASHSARI